MVRYMQEMGLKESGKKPSDPCWSCGSDFDSIWGAMEDGERDDAYSRSHSLPLPQASVRSVRYGPVGPHEIAGAHRSSGLPQQDAGAGERALSALAVFHWGQ